MQDRFWNEYGSLGVFLVMVSVFVAVCVALGGLALFKIWQLGVQEAKPPAVPAPPPLHTLNRLELASTGFQ